MTLNCTEWNIEPNSENYLEILWEPQESGMWRDILQLSDNRRIKYDVPLTLTCIDVFKKAHKSAETLKHKRSAKLAASNTAKNSQKSVLSNTSVTKSSKIKHKSYEKRGSITIGLPDKENVRSNGGFEWMFESSKPATDKLEETIAHPISDFSKILDSSTFKFTPLKSKFTGFESNVFHDTISVNENNTPLCLKKESSIPIERNVQTALRKETYITVPKFLDVEKIENEINNKENNEFEDSLSPKPSEVTEPVGFQNPNFSKSEFSMILNDIKFTPLKNQGQENNDNIIFSPNHCSTAQKIERNKYLNNDLVNFTIGKNATFKADAINNTKENYVLKSVFKTCDKVQLKPTCLANTFDESLDTGISTNNCVSSKMGLSKVHMNFRSAQDYSEAELNIKSEDISSFAISRQSMNSTLESIPEEECDSGKINMMLNSSLETSSKQFKNRKAMCLEFSPPKKPGTNQRASLRKVSPTKHSKVKKDKPVGEVVNSKKKVQIHNSIKSKLRNFLNLYF